MATHFSANQYENAFAANRLQNYQIPGKYKEHPSPQRGCTEIISNERGHLLPGVKRSPASPWGSFKGTWDMDCRKTKHCQNLITTKSQTASALRKNTESQSAGLKSRGSPHEEPATARSLSERQPTPMVPASPQRSPEPESEGKCVEIE